MKLPVKVVPGASCNKISGWMDARLKIRVCAAPENGKANAAVIKLLMNTLKIAKKDIAITHGQTSPLKVVEIRSISEAEVHKIISKLLNL